jgi:hypothetical protein
MVDSEEGLTQNKVEGHCQILSWTGQTTAVSACLQEVDAGRGRNWLFNWLWFLLLVLTVQAEEVFALLMHAETARVATVFSIPQST